jgi:membrane-associated phospholipid phosphatase
VFLHLTGAFALAASLVQARPPAPAPASWPDDKPFMRLPQNLWQDLRALTSRSALFVLAGGGGAALAVHPADDNIADWVLKEDHPIPSWTRFGDVFGEGWVQAGAAVATYAVGKIAHQPRVTHVGSDLIRTQILNGLLTQGIKYATDRDRPNGGARAFPSGHTSATFASAAVLQTHFGWKTGLPAYAVAGIVGWCRVRDAEHWLSDYVFGAALGVASSYAVTLGHRARDWGVVPVKTDGGFAIYLVRTR